MLALSLAPSTGTPPCLLNCFRFVVDPPVLHQQTSDPGGNDLKIARNHTRFPSFFLLVTTVSICWTFLSINQRQRIYREATIKRMHVLIQSLTLLDVSFFPWRCTNLSKEDCISRALQPSTSSRADLSHNTLPAREVQRMRRNNNKNNRMRDIFTTATHTKATLHVTHYLL